MLRDFFEDDILYTVSEITEVVASYIDDDPYLTNVYVRGEVADLKVRGNHVYFALVDDDARLSCVWFGRAQYVDIKNGDVVVAYGSVKVYRKRGSYNFYVESVKKTLWRGKKVEEFFKLLKELERSGILSRERKKLPDLPVKIGIVTSKDSAALKDVMRSLSEKAPLSTLFLFHAQVQGDGAAESIVNAIENAKAFDLDVLIITRGGGSEDDLWVFNNKRVVYSIINLPFPVISAVGHAIDGVILDKVADYSVHTPTAAAELIGDLQRDYINRMETLINQIFHDISHIVGNSELTLKSRFEIIVKSTQSVVEAWERKFQDLFNAVRKFSPFAILEGERRIKELFGKIKDDISRNLEKQLLKLENLWKYIKGISPVKTLERGFAIVMKNGKIIKSVKDVKSGDELEIILKDGKVRVRVDGIFRDSEET